MAKRQGKKGNAAKNAGGLGERLKRASKSEYAMLMGEDDDMFLVQEWLDSGNILLNALASADPYKGFPAGKVIQFAGPQSVGKTFLCLEVLKSAQKLGYFSVLYDSEFANNDRADLEKRGLDLDQLMWVGVDTVEHLKTDVLNILEEIKDGDKAAIMIDSIGNLSTRKELEDSLEGGEKKDMTRQAQLKALFRTCTLKAGVKGIPIFIVNHVYAAIGSYVGGNVVGGGTGSLYASSAIFEMSKAQVKKGDEVVGALISVKSIKNRFARERQKIKIEIDFSKGLDRYSGLLLFCEEEGVFTKEKNSYRDQFTGGLYSKKALTPEAWDKILEAGLADYLRKRFAYQASTEGIEYDDDESSSVESDD